jgi:BASS family bile acid:Na+ symporter
VAEILSKLLTFTLVIFMVGSLLEMGLKLKLDEALKALRNVRFMALGVLWSFVLSPALAVLLTKVLPLSEPYALGLLFLGMAPCAPYLPMISEKARGDLAYVAAYMVLAAVGTVIFMPFMVPVLAKGFIADTWTIAKPLLFFITMPMAIGMAIRLAAETLAEKAHPVVKKVTDINNVIMLVAALVIYRSDFLSAVGTYAIGSQFLYYGLLAAGAYGLGFGLPHAQKSVLALGVCTRNIGAALAPLFAVAGTDKRAIVMCVLATFIAIITGFAGARVLARFAPAGEPATAQTGGGS